jgi:hypothetical protein
LNEPEDLSKPHSSFLSTNRRHLRTLHFRLNFSFFRVVVKEALFLKRRKQALVPVSRSRSPKLLHVVFDLW